MGAESWGGGETGDEQRGAPPPAPAQPARPEPGAGGEAKGLRPYPCTGRSFFARRGFFPQRLPDPQVALIPGLRNLEDRMEQARLPNPERKRQTHAPIV